MCQFKQQTSTVSAFHGENDGCCYGDQLRLLDNVWGFQGRLPCLQACSGADDSRTARDWVLRHLFGLLSEGRHSPRYANIYAICGQVLDIVLVTNQVQMRVQDETRQLLCMKLRSTPVWCFPILIKKHNKSTHIDHHGHF